MPLKNLTWIEYLTSDFRNMVFSSHMGKSTVNFLKHPNGFFFLNEIDIIIRAIKKIKLTQWSRDGNNQQWLVDRRIGLAGCCDSVMSTDNDWSVDDDAVM